MSYESACGTLSSEKIDFPKDDLFNKTESMQISRTDMNMLIMNYLVTEGFKEAALKFQQEAGLSEPALSGSLDQRILIREAVQSGRIQEATALVNALHPELLDNDRYLYFHLQQLHLLELVKAGRVEAALGWARAALAEAAAARPAALPELERSLALLAFPDPANSPFADLLQPQYSHTIASELNAAILRMEHQEFTSPKLSSLLRLILWAQAELDKKNIKYSKMTNLANATIENLKLPSRPDAPDARPVVNDVRQASREDRALIEAVRRVRGLEGI